MIDREIHLARALLVESNPLLRSVTAAQLRDLGVGQVAQASRVKEARLMLEHEHFDIVVCNREFEDAAVSGQDLLDELRRERLLPHSTVFLMVTDHATYHQVVEAAESALDGFLVRPYTAAQLAGRLLEARHRKRELAELLRALDAGESEVALVHAVKRFQEQQPYWQYCGRLAAELLLTLDRPEDARRVFECLLQANPGDAFARLGCARALMAAGDNAAARKVVTAVLESAPGSADAHDLLGRILVDQCDFDAALAQYRSAVEITPGCLLRAQHAGALAFYQGHGEEALKWLDRTLSMGVQSKLFDALSLLLIAILRFDQGDAAGVLSMRQQLQRYRERFPTSQRLQRFELAATALTALLGPEPATALTALRALGAQAAASHFDLEAANMLLALWARAPHAVCPSGEYEALVEQVALRFSVSKAIVEVLAASSRRSEPAAGVIRRCQAQIAALAEQAMDQANKGDAGGATKRLLEFGERTLNARLLELAGAIARKHRATLPDADALAERAAAIVRSSCQAVNHIAGIQRSGRSPGGLQLRGRGVTIAPAVATADAAA